MLKIYGIKNCDTMKKAFTWLDAKGIKYDFHNYKTEGIDEKTILNWLKKLPLTEVINTKSTTWKEFTEEQRSSVSDQKAAIKLMIENTSVIKRPLIDSGKKFLLGFKPEIWEESIGH